MNSSSSDTDNNNAVSPTADVALHAPPSPSPKRNRRSIEKRVVSIPIHEVEGSRTKAVNECTPPSDSWAWRKYGQKPIKGSPYPRGYYRCSSAKGCPARKQVERSRVDPTMLVVTYTAEHSHSYPAPKSNHNGSSGKIVSVDVKEEATVPDLEPVPRNSPESVPEQGESKFSDLIGEDSKLMADEYFWDVGSASSTSPENDTMLYGPIFFGSTELAIDDEILSEFNDEDDALFAGLGELPEFSTVFRRIQTTVVHQ